MFRRWRFVSCVFGDKDVVTQARKIRQYIEKHLDERVECKLELRIDCYASRTFDMYMRLTEKEAAFVRGLTNAEGFYDRATKD